MSNISGKIWGQTKLIHANGVLEFHRIEYKKDISCSKHRHKYKWNGFFVESGKTEDIRFSVIFNRFSINV